MNINYNNIKYVVIGILLGLLLSGCVATSDGIYINSLPRDYVKPKAVEQSPVLGDTSTASMLKLNMTEDELITNVQLLDHLYHMRQRDFYYPRKGGGAYVVRYYEGNVIYAAIIAPNNTTQEDVVFFQEKWYYNQNGFREEIKPNQVTLFVEAIQTSVAEQIDEEGND